MFNKIPISNKLMQDSQHFLNNLWRWKCGLEELPPPEPLTLEDLQANWSKEFETYMRNRLAFGAIRYGFITTQRKATKKFDNLSSIMKRLKIYKETGNLEMLVDVANLCMVEFETSVHPTKHFDIVHDGDHHVETLNPHRRIITPDCKYITPDCKYITPDCKYIIGVDLASGEDHASTMEIIDGKFLRDISIKK